MVEIYYCLFHLTKFLEKMHRGFHFKIEVDFFDKICGSLLDIMDPINSGTCTNKCDARVIIND